MRPASLLLGEIRRRAHLCSLTIMAYVQTCALGFTMISDPSMPDPRRSPPCFIPAKALTYKKAQVSVTTLSLGEASCHSPLQEYRRRSTGSIQCRDHGNKSKIEQFPKPGIDKSRYCPYPPMPDSRTRFATCRDHCL